MGSVVARRRPMMPVMPRQHRIVTDADVDTFAALVTSVTVAERGTVPADAVETVAEFIVGRCGGNGQFVNTIVDRWYRRRDGAYTPPSRVEPDDGL